MADDPDRPSDIPQPAAIAARMRRYFQDLDERDGAGVGRRARTAHLEHEDTDAPVEVPRETTGVREVMRRVDQRALDRGAGPEVRQLLADLAQVLAEHQLAGEKRRMQGDIDVLAGKAPTATATATKWWALLLKTIPVLVVVVGTLSTAVLWVQSAEREDGALRARIGQLEATAARHRVEIDAITAGQIDFWTRFLLKPASPAPPGVSP